jgi:MYXO-CTERM domain-containing protein
VTPNLIDDFQGGTIQGWLGSPTSNVADEGPGGVGDNALLVSAGNRVVTFNEMQWTGNFTAAGISQIAMDVRHANANLANLSMRIGIGTDGFVGGGGPNGIGDTYLTAAINVPNDDAWHRIVFSVTAADFTPSSSNNNPTPDAAAALADVSHFRILHNPTDGDFRGAQAGADFYLDNIGVVPEPTSAALAAAAVAALAARRRKR